MSLYLFGYLLCRIASLKVFLILLRLFLILSYSYPSNENMLLCSNLYFIFRFKKLSFPLEGRLVFKDFKTLSFLKQIIMLYFYVFKITFSVHTVRGDLMKMQLTGTSISVRSKLHVLPIRGNWQLIPKGSFLLELR